MKTLTLLLLLGLCGLSMQDCNRKLYSKKHIFGGKQIGKTLHTYVRQCQKACTDKPTCKYFNFYGGRYCKLFTDGRLRMDSVYWGFTGYSLRYCGVMKCQVMIDVDMQRQSYQQIPSVASVEACSALCYDDPRCRFFGYYRSDGGYRKRNCFLKDGVPIRNTEFDGVTSGYSRRYCK